MTSNRAGAIDTDPHLSFEVYSAGNFAEVAPERLSPMAWSLVGEPVERANRAIARRMGLHSRLHTGSRYIFVGYFACRPFHNLSAYSQLARQLPGVDPAVVADSFFEGIAAPSPRRGLDTRGWDRLRVGGRALREIASLRPRLHLLEGQIEELEGELEPALAAGSELTLGAILARAQLLLDEAWELHYSNTLGIVPLRSLQRSVGNRMVPYWEELEPLVTRTDGLPWDAVREVPRAAGFLNHAFYEVADDQSPWREYNVRFPGSSTKVAREGREQPHREPWSVLPQRAAAVLAPLSRLVATTMECREGSKLLSMRCLHAFRRLLPTLAQAAGVERHDWPYLTIGELSGQHPPAELTRKAAARAEACSLALERAIPDLLDFARPDPWSAPPARSTPRGVSPGKVIGKVVTLDTVSSERERPCVLVCQSADTDIESLLPLVDGLITARGSLLSHISILAREHLLPTVVGCALASSLKPGDRVMLDGESGEVALIELNGG